jgi:cytochrome o ubiquinol oxidase subunit 3
MKELDPISTKNPDPYHDLYSRTIFGFWLFILTDFVLFGALFATFIVLRDKTHGGPGAFELFNIDFALSQSILSLIASFTAGLGGAAVHRKDKKMTLIFFGLTFLFALLFMGFEIADCNRLIAMGHSWDKSAFLSAFYTIIATHGIHVSLGLLWIIVLLIPLIKEEINHESIQRLSCLRMFFQFLNIIWIFIFTIVYFLNRGVV